MKDKTCIILLLLIISSLSGCVDAGTKRIIEEHNKEINEMKEQDIANDISKPYGDLYVSVSQDYYGDRMYISVDGEVELKNENSHVVVKVEDGAGYTKFDTRYGNVKKEYVNDNLLFSRTIYEMNFNGSKEWYDKRLNKDELPEYPTLEKEIPNIQLNINDVVRVGSFNTVIGTSKEVQNINMFRTNSFTISIGVSGESAKVKNPVLFFK